MQNRLLACVACALALGCADLDDTPRAPFCDDVTVCPEGTRCVDGVRCELIPGEQPPRDNPRWELLGGGPRSVGPTRPPASQVDGGELECTGGLVECNGECVDTRADPLNCGGCGRTCAAGVECRLGVCCVAGFETCGDRCVDLQTDPSNCGVCDFPCIEGMQCVFGLCQPPSPTPGPSNDPGVPGFEPETPGF